MDLAGYNALREVFPATVVLDRRPEPGHHVRYVSIGHETFQVDLPHDQILNTLQDAGFMEGPGAHQDRALPLLRALGVSKTRVVFEDVHFKGQNPTQD